MPREQMEKFLQLKETIKPATDLKTLVEKFNVLKELESLAQGLQEESIQYYKAADDYRNRASSYRSHFLISLYKPFQENKLGMSMDDFLNVCFGDKAESIKARMNEKVGFSLSPSQAEVAMSNIHLLNENVLNECALEADKSFKYGREYADVTVTYNAPIRTIIDNPELKEEFINNSKLSKEETETILNDVDQIVRNSSEKLNAFMDIGRLAIEKMNTKIENDRKKEAIDSLSKEENSLFTFGQGVHTFTGFKSVEEKESFEKNHHYTFSDSAKTKLTTIVNKMREYGIISKEAAQEESIKEYAFKHYAELKREIGKTTDAEKLKQLVSEFKLEKEHLREVMNLCKETFGEESYPGNLDVARNNNIESEFSMDLAGSSWMNSIYGMYSFVSLNNYSLDQFFEDPLKVVSEITAKYNNITVIEKAKEVSFEEAYSMLNNTGKAAYPGIALGRVFELVSLVDRENFKESAIATALFGGINGQVGNYTTSQVIRQFDDDNGLGYKVMAGLTFEDPKDYGKMLDGAMDLNTGVIIHYDPEQSIKEKDIDVELVTERINKMISYNLKNTIVKGANEDLFVEHFNKIANMIVNAKSLTGPESELLVSLSKATKVDDLTEFTNKYVEKSYVKAFAAKGPEIELKDMNNNVLSVEEAAKKMVNDELIGAYKDGKLVDFYSKTMSNLPNGVDYGVNMSQFIDENGNLKLDALNEKIQKDVESISSNSKVKGDVVAKYYASLADKITSSYNLDNKESYYLNNLKDVTNIKELKAFPEKYHELEASANDFDLSITSKNVKCTDINNKELSYKDAVNAFANKQQLLMYSKDNLFVGIAQKQGDVVNTTIPLAHDFKNATKEQNLQFLTQMRKNLASHNPFIMRLRNLFSSGPYSQIIDAIDNLKKKDVGNPDVMLEGLKKIEEKASNYYKGKLTDGKKATELNESRKEAAFQVFANVKMSVSSYEHLQVLEENETLENETRVQLDPKEVENDLHENKEVNKDFVVEEDLSKNQIVK